MVYDGYANVAVIGHRTTKLPADRLNDLLSQLEAMHFLDSSEKCCVCPEVADGGHLVILDYRPGSLVKTVLHDDSCRSAPPALGVIESTIDRATGVAQWTSPLVASQQ